MDDDADRLARARVATVLDDKWTLELLLGVGGMAAVYAARHRNGARAAVKVLHPHLSRYSEVRERFQREGYAANQVDHPGVVKVLDDDVVSTGPEAGTAYIVMELLDGRSMQDRLEQGPSMSELEFLRIADCVLDVLCAAHARGVIHRDLKPENLFLVRDDAAAAFGTRVKVLDFGLARLLQGQAITTYGLALGTPSFMSPEQAAGRLDEIDGRTDLFALAATGFRLRTGRRIHEGANPVELVTKMASLPAPRIRSFAADVSEPFARVVDRALAFRREDRYGGAAEMQTDVRRAMSELDEVGATQLAVPLGARLDVPGAPAREAPARDESGTSAGPELPVLKADKLEAPWLRRKSGPEEKLEKPRSRKEAPTIELSVSDLELVSPRERAPRRYRWYRSILPWAAAALFAGIGARLWLEDRTTDNEPTSLDPAANPPSTEQGAGGEATAKSPGSRGAGAASPTEEPMGSARGPHHSKPVKPGSGKELKPAH